MQLLGTGDRQGVVINDRRGAHALNPAVEPLGVILARHVVERELEFQSAQHPVVGGLSQVIGKLRRLDIAVGIGDVDVDLVEQELVLRHMFGRGT